MGIPEAITRCERPALASHLLKSEQLFARLKYPAESIEAQVWQQFYSILPFFGLISSAHTRCIYHVRDILKTVPAYEYW